MMSDQAQPERTSPKSYGTAVALCGVFGTIGIHHFYLGNIAHGLLDVGLFVLFIWCLVIANPLWMVVLLIDLIHTFVVFYQLIVEEARDGDGLRVTIN